MTYRRASQCALALLLAVAREGASASVGYDEGEEGFEWAGIFDLSGSTVNDPLLHWVAQKVDGDYADATMNIVVMSVSSDSSGVLEEAEVTADILLDADSCSLITSSTTITPSSAM